MMNDIGKLLFHRIEELRDESGGKIEINQLDSIVSSFIETMKAHVTNQSELTIYNEIEKIANQIRNAKQEIATLNPGNISDNFIPGAASELNAVTRATEQSTNNILDAAEAIQNIALDMSDDPKTSNEICEHVIKIFEACNFQDITGQRITKVIKILEDIEGTVNTLIRAFSSAPEDRKIKSFSEKDLLNGPQPEGRAPNQDQIDDMFSTT